MDRVAIRIQNNCWSYINLQRIGTYIIFQKQIELHHNQRCSQYLTIFKNP